MSVYLLVLLSQVLDPEDCMYAVGQVGWWMFCDCKGSVNYICYNHPRHVFHWI